LLKIRRGTLQDLPFLEQMLFEAFFWDPSWQRPEMKEFLRQPPFCELLMDWGQRSGDTALIAERTATSVGAAWYRYWSDEHHFYGYVDPETPELGIAVQVDRRSHGIGRSLLCALINTARQEGIPKLSLSVNPNNFARQLYESEGFIKVGEFETSWTMAMHL
jgi:ribosomal protein S18 acetylase RimI-like enzyme